MLKATLFDISRAIVSHEAGALCGMSDGYMGDRRRKGDGPPFWKFGKRTYYMPEDVHAWIATRRFRQWSRLGSQRDSN